MCQYDNSENIKHDCSLPPVAKYSYETYVTLLEYNDRSENNSYVKYLTLRQVGK